MPDKTKAELLEDLQALNARVAELELRANLDKTDLWQNEDQFHQLAENIGEVFWIANPQLSKFHYVSRAFLEIWGQSCESLYNEPSLWLETVYEEDRPMVTASLTEKIAQESVDIVYRIIRPGGEMRWVRNRAAPILDQSGQVDRLAGVAEDITDWKRSEAARLESDARLRAVMTSTLDPMLTAGSDGIIQMASDSVERVLGWTPQEMVGQNLKVLMPEPHHSEHDQYLINYFNTGKTNILGRAREFEAVRKDGTPFPCEITVWRVDLPGYHEPLFTGIVRDISQRKQSEKALRESQEWLSTTLTSIGDGVIATDTQGRVTFMNPVAKKLTGWDGDGLQQPIEKVFPIINEHTRNEVENPVVRVLRDGEIVGLANHTALISRDGTEYTIADSGSPIRNLEGEITGAVLVFRDITEVRIAERRAREHEEELAHVMRLSTMGELASGIAHELNQPLTAIAAFAEACSEMLKSESFNKQETIHIAGRISEQSHRAGEIIRRLRKFVSKRELQRATVQINDAVSEVASLTDSELLASETKVRYELADNLPLVMGDMIQIEQVILNLVRNGIEAMHDKEIGQRVLAIRTSHSQAGNIEISVSDTGEGIADENLERVFEPFFTTKAQGMGIGLAISHSIAESHGGNLTVLCNPQGGATFQFMLPTIEGN